MTINIYLDERIEENPDKATFIVASFVLGTSSIVELRQAFTEVMQVKKNRRAKKLITFIDKYNSLAIITYANIPQDLARAGEIDTTLDIPNMKRRDNIWAQCIIFNLAKMCARLSIGNVPMGNVRVFFDPKALPRLLENAFRNYICTRIPKIAKEYDASNNVKFNQVQFIEKSNHIKDATQEQIGISISHHLMTSFAELRCDANLQRICLEDQTIDLLDGLRPFVET